MSKERVEAFSDGVFAIILTLLVLELRVPAIADHSTLRQYAVVMAPLVPKVLTFALTFVVICIHWVGHHTFYRQLKGATVGLVWLNNFFLLWLCFLPFPTAMLGDHLTDQFPILLYGVDSLLCAVAFYALRSYSRHAGLFKADQLVRVHGPGHSVPAIILYAASLLLALVSPFLSLACFVIVPVLYFVPNMMHASVKS
jgi:uncharacterized membrane protein